MLQAAGVLAVCLYPQLQYSLSEGASTRFPFLYSTINQDDSDGDDLVAKSY